MSNISLTQKNIISNSSLDQNCKLCSVIIPAYNCSNTITETVQSALNQSYNNLEIIIINDCSTDNTLSVIENLAKKNRNIKIINQNINLGVAKTRNNGFDHANGDYIALLDADDIWFPSKTEKQIEYIKSNSIDLCCTSYSFIDKNGIDIKKPYYVPKEITFEKLLSENVIGCSSVIMKREIIDNIRMSNKYSHEDYAFWLDILKNGYTASGMNEILMKYRSYIESRSGNKYNSAKNRWIIYRDFLKFNTAKSIYYFSKYAINALSKHSK